MVEKFNGGWELMNGRLLSSLEDPEVAQEIGRLVGTLDQ